VWGYLTIKHAMTDAQPTPNTVQTHPYALKKYGLQKKTRQHDRTDTNETNVEDVEWQRIR